MRGGGEGGRGSDKGVRCDICRVIRHATAIRRGSLREIDQAHLRFMRRVMNPAARYRSGAFALHESRYESSIRRRGWRRRRRRRRMGGTEGRGGGEGWLRPTSSTRRLGKRLATRRRLRSLAASRVRKPPLLPFSLSLSLSLSLSFPLSSCLQRRERRKNLRFRGAKLVSPRRSQ